MVRTEPSRAEMGSSQRKRGPVGAAESGGLGGGGRLAGVGLRITATLRVCRPAVGASPASPRVHGRGGVGGQDRSSTIGWGVGTSWEPGRNAERTPRGGGRPRNAGTRVVSS